MGAQPEVMREVVKPWSGGAARGPILRLAIAQPV